MTIAIDTLRSAVEQESAAPTRNAEKVFRQFLDALDQGTVRTADHVNGEWTANAWVKQGILLGFRLGTLKDLPSSGNAAFFDKHTLPLKRLSRKDNVRIVPGGTSIRKGAFVSPSVIVMPPAFINIGAWIGPDTMVDSHALVGSCAVIGARVHLSAAVQIGGVLEPIGALPVIVEDDVMIGGQCGIFEGTIIRRRAVLGTGVILNASTPVYDLVHQRIVPRSANGTLIIPENAVVVAGSRAVRTPFGAEHGLSVYTPVIVKYRDERTDARTALEDALR
ncbi:MAG: 2,3,4,5-tetrahydropyridine-2,6-dicarboxylate N-succinyltransferase [Bacteroidetes bacterium]|nr:2,3,4,5-tetrahydropyridine-2,6-dicarboxylate N-succinyltransferase [Bacteroidota bacterium]